MSMLVSVQNFCRRFGLETSIPSVTEKITRALIAATPHIASTLRTEFPRKVNSDIFFVDSKETPWIGKFPEFRLSNGFVFEDPAATPDPIVTTIKIASTYSELSVAETMAVGDYILVPEKGVIRVIGDESITTTVSALVGSEFYLQAGYTSGLEVIENRYGMVYQGVPSWMEEAAYLLAYHLYKQDCVTSSKKSAKGTNIDPAIFQLIARYIRFYPSAYKPIN